MKTMIEANGEGRETDDRFDSGRSEELRTAPLQPENAEDQVKKFLRVDHVGEPRTLRGLRAHVRTACVCVCVCVIVCVCVCVCVCVVRMCIEERFGKGFVAIPGPHTYT